MPEFTKGEWILSKALGDHYDRFKGDYAVRVGSVNGSLGDGCIVAICPNEGQILNAKFNAQLILAAPDMYEALKEANNLIEASADNQDVVMHIHEALAKAEGKNK
jgi:hypothetical protein